MPERADEPPFNCGDDERCRDDGCPFDRADQAPDNCARTVEARRWLEMNRG
jgi:hypothetical protein